MLRTISHLTGWRYDDVYDYSQFARRMLAKSRPRYTRFPTVTPGWDNTVRRKYLGTILDKSSPEAYQEWLTRAIEDFEPPSQDENFVFINAWNEWGEGCHLEPDRRWGNAYLEATFNVLRNEADMGLNLEHLTTDEIV